MHMQQEIIINNNNNNNNNNNAQAFNQLNPTKDISNFFTPKKNVNKKFTEKSYLVRFGACYASVPDYFCFLDKNKQNYLIGIKPNYVYNVYDAQKNWREKISGRELIKKYDLIGFHFLTVEKQRFANMQKANPFFLQFKNAQESMEWHRQQVAKEREELKTFLMSRKKKSDPEKSENDIISIANADYEKKLSQTIEELKRQHDIDIEKLNHELESNDLIIWD